MRAEQEDLRQRFREIGVERLRTLNQALLELEQGEGDEATADLAMREIHTFKGESRMLGFAALNRVAHRTEDLLLHARAAGLLQDASWLQHVYAGFDLMAELLEEESACAEAADEPRAAAFAAEIEARLVAAGAATRAAPEPPTPTARKSERATEVAPATPPAMAASPAAAPASEDGSQRVARATIDEITRTAGEVGVLQSQLRELAESGARLQERARQALSERTAAADGPSPRGASQGATGSLRGTLDEMDDLLRAMRDIGFEASIRQHRLQDAVERMRLATVSTLFGRFPRAVRDLARELGKEARLAVDGEHVGADQQVLELLADPLLHLVRNAVDHGLEPPESREAAGKPRRGTIRLSARQAGRFVEILVEDDGRGVDPRVVADAAVRKGLLSEADVGRMSERELLEQLFRPAFSTRTNVSDVSGRGVGLDVVKTAVEGLGGSLRIESEVGRGTTFVLRLPVSIALVNALVLDLGSALYAIPSAYVHRVLELDEADLQVVGDWATMQLAEGTRAPVLDLLDVLHFPARKDPQGSLARVLVLADGARRLALRVPGFVGEMALVQEALGRFLNGLRLVTGTAMLDGGRRVVLLNAIQLFELAATPRAEPTLPASSESAQRGQPTVLVVEDSELTRSMLASTLMDAGWRVLEAVNGQVACECFEREEVDIVITDLEMPVVDGVELTRAIRSGARHPDVPIVVLTTRDDPDAKQLAAEAGADVYLLKASFERDEILETLDRLLASSGREEGR